MLQFPDYAQLASWVGLCPGNAESARKQFSGKTRKESVFAAHFGAERLGRVPHEGLLFGRGCFIESHKNVAGRMQRWRWPIIRDNTDYREYGGDYYDRRQPERTVKRLTQRSARIGYDVVLTPRTEAAMTVNPPEPSDCRKRGRPCKCAERGITCLHQRNQTVPQAPLTLAANVESGASTAYTLKF
jgi:hypothetical protein